MKAQPSFALMVEKATLCTNFVSSSTDRLPIFENVSLKDKITKKLKVRKGLLRNIKISDRIVTQPSYLPLLTKLNSSVFSDEVPVTQYFGFIKKTAIKLNNSIEEKSKLTDLTTSSNNKMFGWKLKTIKMKRKAKPKVERKKDDLTSLEKYFAKTKLKNLKLLKRG